MPRSHSGSTAPRRTADQNHAYTAEQQAYDGGKADLFPKYTGKATNGGAGAFGTKGQVMGYFDGNTVTAMWNYAQHFAMSDNAYSDTYGPSTPGMLNLVSGQTNGMTDRRHEQEAVHARRRLLLHQRRSGRPDDDQRRRSGLRCLLGPERPGDDGGQEHRRSAQRRRGHLGRRSWAGSSSTRRTQRHDRLQAQHAFDGRRRRCRGLHPAPCLVPVFRLDRQSDTCASEFIAAIGYSLEADGKTHDPANHNYDLQDFYDAVKAGNFPSVSYIKLPAYQDGHAGYSDPLDEQAGTVALINFLQQQPDWENTAVIVTWDDSDGWYDHAFAAATSPHSMPKPISLTAPANAARARALSGVERQAGERPLRARHAPAVPGRSRPGPRQIMWVTTQISLASVVRFIEDNWLHGQRLGGGSFDAAAGSITDMFDFSGRGNTPRFTSIRRRAPR